MPVWDTTFATELDLSIIMTSWARSFAMLIWASTFDRVIDTAQLEHN